MGRQPKANITLDTRLTDLPTALRWREWIGRVEGVIFTAVCAQLAEAFRNIPPGPKAASEYHTLVLGSFDAPAVSHEQSNAQRVFQQLDTTREGRLDYAERDGGLRNAALPGRLDEKAERDQIHIDMIC